MNVLTKDQLEASLHNEKKLIETGKLKDDNPLDSSPLFIKLCDASRRGDLKGCQESILEGVNINARDRFDYTPLILASLCGHYEVVQLLLESGALCERDTFQGERCLYNALNDRIRNLLLSYDFSKSTDPLQPLASHVTSIFTREHPKTSDIIVSSGGRHFSLHKFILASRSPYFRNKLSVAPETNSFKVPTKFPPQSFAVAMRYLYLGEIPTDIGGGPGMGFTEEEVLEGLDKLSRLLEIPSLWDSILEKDRRLARQYRTQETERARTQLQDWFESSVVRHKVIVDSSKADDIRWDRDNGIYADLLLRADEDVHEAEVPLERPYATNGSIPVGPSVVHTVAPVSQRSVLFPVHRAMLLRSEYFLAMFSSSFLEAQDASYLRIIPIDCSPEVLEAILRYIYTERADFPLEIAVEVLFAADQLLMERLKNKAAVTISSLGSGVLTSGITNPAIDGKADLNASPEAIDPFQILKAAWLLRVPRLEEFAARYFAYRLEQYIDIPEFTEAIKESAARIKQRQETDSIELVDDIRHYLSERFRLRFEGEGLEEMLNEAAEEGNSNAFDSEGKNQMFTKGDAPQGDIDNVGQIRTLDGELAGDEFASDAINYQILLGKIDALLDRLELDG